MNMDPLDALLLAVLWGHVKLAPFTKVEESFNLHATHDVMAYGLSSGNLYLYDHFEFPGALPRSFIGSILLAWISQTLLFLINLAGVPLSKFDLQVAVRMVLATCSGMTILLLRRAVSKRIHPQAGNLFMILTITQFHLPFWMGRTLSNMFALILTNVSWWLLLGRTPSNRSSRTSTAVGLLTLTAVIFRVEVALLLGPIALQALIRRDITFASLLKTGILWGMLSVVLTVLVDSYLWRQWPLWPELYSLYFNVYLGKSVEWGTSPKSAYFTQFLPKLLLGTAVLGPVGVFVNQTARSLVLPCTVFLAAISLLEHKEWRFIIYIVPVFNIAAACGAQWLIRPGQRSTFNRALMRLVFLAIVLGNIAVTATIMSASRRNYPGGEALRRLNEQFASETSANVHICDLAAQTGASVFLHEHAVPRLTDTDEISDWIYNKTEPALAQRHTHIITEHPALYGDMWEVVDTVQAFDGFALLPQRLREWRFPIEMKLSPKLWTLALRKT